MKKIENWSKDSDKKIEPYEVGIKNPRNILQNDIAR